MSATDAKPRKVLREDEEVSTDQPGAAFAHFLVMEDLLDKLKLLNYEKDFSRQMKLRPLHKHYFAIPTNPGEQFFTFTALASWLIRKSGKKFDTPLESDDPNSTIATILDHTRKLNIAIDFPPNRLKQGYGENVIYILDHLADEALKNSQFKWSKPIIPKEEDEPVQETDVNEELDLDQIEEEMALQYASDEEESENYLNFNIKPEVLVNHVRAEVLESNADYEAWKLEVERVTPLLKLGLKQDSRDWRNRLESLRQHSLSVSGSLNAAQSFLDKMSSEISRSMDRIETREKYLNTQLEPLLKQYRQLKDKQTAVQEKYRASSIGVQERTRRLNQINEEILHVKNQVEERSSNMTDGGPLISVKKALGGIKQELSAMDIRIGVLSHLLLQARLKESTAFQVQLLASSSFKF
nr:EOG090X0ADS [Eulimnadia texana]